MPQRTVDQIMSQNLLYLREGERTELALPHIVAFGVTAVPVLDAAHRPVGVVSLHDVVADRLVAPSPRARDDREERVAPRALPLTVRADARVEDAARLLAERGGHQLVVVDAAGRAVGMVSALDLLRALVGVAPSHPAELERFGTDARS